MMLSTFQRSTRPRPNKRTSAYLHFPANAANFKTVMMEEEAFAAPVSNNMEQVRSNYDDERCDVDYDDTFYAYQQQQQRQHQVWPDICSNNIHVENHEDGPCYIPSYHEQPEMWERTTADSPSLARREGYPNSVIRAIDNEAAMFDVRDDYHQNMNASDGFDDFEASNNHIVMQTTTSAVDVARSRSNGHEQQHIVNGISQNHANPPSYGYWQPTEPTFARSRQPPHCVSHMPQGHYYHRPAEAPQNQPCPIHGYSEYERGWEESQDYDDFLPCPTTWTVPHTPAGDNYEMGCPGSSSFSTDEQHGRTEASMAPITNVISSDTQDCHVSFSDRVSTPFKMRRNPPPQAGQVVQTPQGPALLLLAANIPSPAVRPFLALHRPRTAPSRSTAAATAAASDTTPTPKRRFQRWTDEEDCVLRDACSKEPGPPFNWIRIASHYFKNERSPTQCKSRWGKALQPGIHRGKWQTEEDALIVELKQEGRSFADIAKHIDGRTAEHIRERWISTLDPSNRYEPWSEQEVKTLFEAQARLGNKWSEIAKILPGRSEIAVKNRYHNARTSERRKVRRFAAEMMRADRLERARQLNKLVVPSPVGVRSSLNSVVIDETLPTSAKPVKSGVDSNESSALQQMSS